MRRGILAALTCAVVVSLSGCGAATVPSVTDQVPALSARLDRIDTALINKRYGAARRALTSLVTDTRRAAEAGDVSDEVAARILAAARRLLALLPQQSDPKAPTSTPSPTPTVDARPSAKATPRPTAAVTSEAPPPPTAEPSATSDPEPSPSATPSAEPSGEATPSATPTAVAAP